MVSFLSPTPPPPCGVPPCLTPPLVSHVASTYYLTSQSTLSYKKSFFLTPPETGTHMGPGENRGFTPLSWSLTLPAIFQTDYNLPTLYPISLILPYLLPYTLCHSITCLFGVLSILMVIVQQRNKYFTLLYFTLLLSHSTWLVEEGIYVQHVHTVCTPSHSNCLAEVVSCILYTSHSALMLH
jgi:hypothetical protein